MKKRKPSNRKGLFITFEGIEGSGKSTQVAMLAQALKAQGFEVTVAVEPGGTALGQKIRSELLHGEEARTPEAETLLYMASRAQLYAEVIRPRIEAGHIVIADRWLEATLAYQGYGMGVDLNWIRSIARGFLGRFVPDLTILLETSVTQGLERAVRRGKLDRIESRKRSFHEKVRSGYRRLVTEVPSMRSLPSDSVKRTHERVMAETFKLIRRKKFRKGGK